MSELKMMATTLWTQLVTAMHADGLLDASITQSGPATTKVIVETCRDAMMASTIEAPWLKMDMHPTPGKWVVAYDNNGMLHVLSYSEEHTSWIDVTHAKVSEDAFGGWRFVNAPA